MTCNASIVQKVCKNYAKKVRYKNFTELRAKDSRYPQILVSLHVCNFNDIVISNRKFCSYKPGEILY